MDKHKTRTKKEPATATGKWAWQETGDAEFEVRRRKETHYRIFRLAGKNRTRPKKVTVYKFWAKSRNEALSVLKAYSEDHPGETYYYSTSGYHVCGDGTRHDDLDDVLSGSGSKRERAESEAARRRFVAERKRIYAAIKAFFDSLKTRDPELRGMIGDFRFFVRHYDMVSGKSHQRSESWNIAGAILDLLDFNLPRLAKENHGVPNEFCEKARRRLGEARSPNGEVSEEAMELAAGLWREEIGKLRLYVRLYMFYAGFCLVDGRKREEVELYEKYKDTIPYLPGTYKELDYGKLEKLETRYWKLWIAQFRKIGRSLWD